MGLDIVEMMMRIEEEFEIEIPDEVAVTFTTPGQIIDYLMSLPKFSDQDRPREYIADKVRRIIEAEAPIEPHEYHEDSRFIEDMGMD